MARYAPSYKQKCSRCKKNYVLVKGWRSQYVVCYDCQKEELKGVIKDPKMKKMFKIPEEFYKESSFLRDIKSKYLRFGELTDRQIEVFKEVVEKMKHPELEEEPKKRVSKKKR